MYLPSGRLDEMDSMEMVEGSPEQTGVAVTETIENGVASDCK